MSQYTYQVYLGYIGPYGARVREPQLARYLKYCQETPYPFRAVSFANTSITDAQLARAAPRDGRFYEVCLDGCTNITSKSLQTTLVNTPRLSLFGTKCEPSDITHVMREGREMNQPAWVLKVAAHLFGVETCIFGERIPFVQIPANWHVRTSLLFAMITSHGHGKVVPLDLRDGLHVAVYRANGFFCHHLPPWLDYSALVTVTRACVNLKNNGKRIAFLATRMPDEWDSLTAVLKDVFLPLVLDRATMDLKPGEILY